MKREYTQEELAAKVEFSRMLRGSREAMMKFFQDSLDKFYEENEVICDFIGSDLAQKSVHKRLGIVLDKENWSLEDIYEIAALILMVGVRHVDELEEIGDELGEDADDDGGDGSEAGDSGSGEPEATVVEGEVPGGDEDGRSENHSAE